MKHDEAVSNVSTVLKYIHLYSPQLVVTTRNRNTLKNIQEKKENLTKLK